MAAHKVLPTPGYIWLSMVFRDVGETQGIHDEQESQGVKTLYLDADMSVTEQITEVIETMPRECNSIDILVNNEVIQMFLPLKTSLRIGGTRR